MSQFVWIGSSGCLLPLLIIFNLLFGKFFFNSTRLWLGIEALLILIFIININIMARKISRQFSNPQGTNRAPGGQRYTPKRQVVDIQGQVVEEEKKLK